mmetsp:Transcript_40010/g.83671  ORF Transcript_40010/g.83671 Transcript_40010/m.83671 type:complete len:311 (-) Transcript_40010:80-1012(-)
MISFVFFALSDYPHFMSWVVRLVQDTRWFRSERRRRARFGFFHLILKVLQAKKEGVYLFIQLASTVLIAPVSLAVSESVDCREYEGKVGKYLEKFGNIKCYEGEHNLLRWLILPSFVLYIFLLIPYACCSGDASYVPHATLRDWSFWREDSMWRTAAKRKATDLNLGFLHPMPEYAFRTQFVDFCVKVALPIITTEFHGYSQMIIITAVGTFQMVDVCRYRPFLEEKFSAVVQCLKMVTVSAMFTGILTLYVNDPTSLAPTAVLGVLLVAIIGYLIDRMNNIPMTRQRIRIYNAEREPAPIFTDDSGKVS